MFKLCEHTPTLSYLYSSVECTYEGILGFLVVLDGVVVSARAIEELSPAQNGSVGKVKP